MDKVLATRETVSSQIQDMPLNLEKLLALLPMYKYRGVHSVKGLLLLKVTTRLYRMKPCNNTSLQNQATLRVYVRKEKWLRKIRMT